MRVTTSLSSVNSSAVREMRVCHPAKNSEPNPTVAAPGSRTGRCLAA